MFRIDLNCDLGESFGQYTLGNDEAILDYVTSANVACGFHAGDPTVMRKTVHLAATRGVKIGAHPGFPDLVGFGRRNMDITPSEAYDLTVYQVGAIEAFCRVEGVTLHHVKPHGALYNMAAKNASLAEAIANAVFDVDKRLILYGLCGSALTTAAKQIGLPFANEVFADRTYQDDGSLTPRSKPGSMIEDDNQAIAQVIRMVKEGKVRSLSGTEVDLEAHTVCIHGDGPHALTFAKRIQEELRQAGVKVACI